MILLGLLKQLGGNILIAHILAFIVVVDFRTSCCTRSMMPLKSASAPMGSWMGTALAPSRSFIMSTTRKKSAPMISILLT